MNSNSQNNSYIDAEVPISLLPKDSIQTKYHFRWRLGFIPQWKKKTVKVIYSVCNGILQVGFEKPNGIHFIGQHSAEEWFYGPINISPHVGKHVVESIHDVHHHSFCKNCGIDYVAISRRFIGTEDMFNGNNQVAIEFIVKCPTCDGIRTLDIHEQCG